MAAEEKWVEDDLEEREEKREILSIPPFLRSGVVLICGSESTKINVHAHFYIVQMVQDCRWDVSSPMSLQLDVLKVSGVFSKGLQLLHTLFNDLLKPIFFSVWSYSGWWFSATGGNVLSVRRSREKHVATLPLQGSIRPSGFPSCNVFCLSCLSQHRASSLLVSDK